MKKQFKKLGFSFLPIPEELMKSKAISFGAKFLFGIIAKANMESVRWSVKYLAKRMGCQPRETTYRINELVENNLIVIKRRKGKTNEYQVNFELINIIQKDTPAQTFRGQNVQGGDEHSMQGSNEHSVQDIKEPILKKINKEGLLKLKKLKNPLLEKSKMPK